ncbi:MAG TPA: archaeosortase/exosortase family protein [Cytophagaceae bacterium]|jgi:exosortase/archaeosortase family protein
MKFNLSALAPSTRNLLSFLFKLIIIYSILDFSFYSYVGLVDPKGSYDLSSTIIGKYNLIEAITTATIYPVSWLLNIFGYSTYLYNNVVGIRDFGGIKIMFPCLGIKMWIAFFSLIAAYPTKQNWKVISIFIIFGIAVIHFFNIVRMFLLALTNRYYGSDDLHDKIFQRHHDVFNLVVGAVVLMMFYIWVRQFNKISFSS